MDYCETAQGVRIRSILTDEELGLTALDELESKVIGWVQYSKENPSGRTTRSANRNADILYKEIMDFELPGIQLKKTLLLQHENSKHNNRSQLNTTSDSSDRDSHASSQGSIVRNLRSRTRSAQSNVASTPSGKKAIPKKEMCTPQNQKIRSVKQPASSGSSVLSAAMNQQHPSVSMTKTRQLLRADSVQKKREEEKKRQERMMQDRKEKEARAEAQKRQILEERAISTKQKREERLLHAAELRKRKEAELTQRKLQEEAKQQEIKQEKEKAKLVLQQKIQMHQQQTQKAIAEANEKEGRELTENQALAHETFNKNTYNENNIDIVIAEETQEESKEQAPVSAAWARAHLLRDALIAQYSESKEQRRERMRNIFPSVKLPVELEEIFGPKSRNICRTSSAIWSPPQRPIKRTSEDLSPNIHERH